MRTASLMLRKDRDLARTQPRFSRRRIVAMLPYPGKFENGRCNHKDKQYEEENNISDSAERLSESFCATCEKYESHHRAIRFVEISDYEFLTDIGGQWNHPNMPWDGTELWIADFHPEDGLTKSRGIAGGPGESVFQPEWSPAGILHFVPIELAGGTCTPGETIK